MLRNWLAAILAAIFLAACGGGSEDDDRGRSEPFGDFSTAVSVNATLTGTRLDHAREMLSAATRRHALSANAAAAPTRVLTDDELFNWAQRTVTSLFPGNPPNQTITASGWSYVYRHYAVTNNYLGVRSDGAVVVLFSDGRLVHYGYKPDYTCDVFGCGSVTPTDAGPIVLEIDKHTVTPKVYDGKILGTSAGELNPADLDRICVEGPGFGFDTTTTCGTFQNGRAVISGVSNNDKVQYVGRKKGSGERIWLTIDQGATTHFTFSGLNARYRDGFVEYSEYLDPAQPDVVYRKPSLRMNGGNLELHTGRNSMSGTFGLDGRLTNFSVGNFQFRFQPRSGEVRATAVSTWDNVTKQYKVVFSDGLACSNSGTITAHRQIIGGGYSTSVVGWLAVGRNLPATATTPAEPANIVVDFIGPGVIPVVDTGAGFYGFRYQRSGC